MGAVGRWVDALAQDVRFGVRTLVRSPAFAATAVLILALSTGATTAIFSIVDSVLLRPLPFADPGRLVQVYGRVWSQARDRVADPLEGPVGSLELEAYAQQSATVAAFAGYALTTRHLHDPSGVERLTAVQADLGFFSLLGVAPVVGRTFRADDPSDVVVISANLWQRRFAGDPSVPGSRITLDGRPFTIIGVMPGAFQFPYGAASMMPGALPETRTDLWVPLEPVRAAPAGPVRRGRVSVVGRLKPGVGLAAAAGELRVIAGRVERQAGDPNTRVDVRLVPLAEVVVGSVGRSLWLLFAAVGLVLVAACANVANLLLARMTLRAHEVVTRAALGASRHRLVQQFLTESLLLALAGGLAGAAVALWGTNLLVTLGSAKIPRAHEIVLDWRAFGFLLTACLTTAILFGLAPALTAARLHVQAIARASAGHATPGRSFGRMRDGLVVTEMALAFVLGLGAALVIREAVRLRNVDAGMTTVNVLTMHVTPRSPAGVYGAIEERVARLPGVRAAGFTQLLPLQNWGWEAEFSIQDRVQEGRPTAGLRYVTPGYFRALGIPLLRGRTFTERDHADARTVVLVNDALARRYFGDADPVGIQLDRGTIVGVVGDVRQVGLDRPAEPEIYYAAAQNVTMASDIGMTLIVRAAGRPEPLIDPVRAAVRDVNPELAVFNVRTMEQVLADSLWELNLYRWLIALFAALAVVLAVIGLNGLISYSITSRTREFAVRLALGSDRARLAWLVLARGALLAGAGLTIGILVSLAVTPSLRTVASALHGDAATYAGTAAVLLAFALAACILPAIRAARVNPAAALRHD
jgi:predicted permease